MTWILAIPLLPAICALVMISARRVKLAFTSACPAAEVFAIASRRLRS